MILVAGGTGDLGGRVVRLLRVQGHDQARVHDDPGRQSASCRATPPQRQPITLMATKFGSATRPMRSAPCTASTG
jgi:hypothetical protein